MIHHDKRLGNNKRITILQTFVDVLDTQETVTLVEQYVIKKEPLHLMGVNADKINELNRNPRLKKIVNNCGIINADGISVIKASRILNKGLSERVAGVDLMLKLIELSEVKGYSIFLLGAKQEVVEKTAHVLQVRYPKLNIVGLRNGYFKESQWKDISSEIKKVQPDFVFVGITSPTKEYLINFLQNEGHNSVFMGVGGSFDVISGKIPRAPKWMQRLGLEWLFRVIQEPKRLFKRYFCGNITFIRAVIKEKSTQRRSLI